MSSKIIKTFKYRINPTRRQASLLGGALEECRWLYNHLLAERKHAWENEQKSLNYHTQAVSIPPLKAERPSLATVNAQVLQNVAVRVDLAYKAFFRRVKAGEKEVGYPRFKGYGRYDSLTFPQVQSSCEIKNGKLVVSKIGHIRIILHRPVEGTPKTATLQRTSTGKWYVTFSCEVEPKRLPKRANPVGLDVGLHTFATMSDATAIENPRFFRREEKELAKVQRKLSKAEKGTKERRFRRKAVGRVHERTAFKRDNFSHQHSRKVVDGYGVIAVEDLQVNRMLHNHCLAKSISDAAWSGFFSMLFYKAEEAGRTFIKVNPAYTSQTCSTCGHRQKMPLSERVFNCPCCNLHLDRDHNASLNILRIGLDSLRNQSLEAALL
jgi:putative transposase